MEAVPVCDEPVVVLHPGMAGIDRAPAAEHIGRLRRVIGSSMERLRIRNASNARCWALDKLERLLFCCVLVSCLIELSDPLLSQKPLEAEWGRGTGDSGGVAKSSLFDSAQTGPVPLLAELKYGKYWWVLWRRLAAEILNVGLELLTAVRPLCPPPAPLAFDEHWYTVLCESYDL